MTDNRRIFTVDVLSQEDICGFVERFWTPTASVTWPLMLAPLVSAKVTLDVFTPAVTLIGVPIVTVGFVAGGVESPVGGAVTRCRWPQPFASAAESVTAVRLANGQDPRGEIPCLDNDSTTMPSSSSPEFAADEGGTMAQITIREGLAWLKTLKKRHEELLALRNDNAHRERRFYGASADKEIVKEPVYDVKDVDRLVTRVAREIRLLEQALKTPNARTAIDAYDQDDAVLGELS
jgi:hypothetical protein